MKDNTDIVLCYNYLAQSHPLRGVKLPDGFWFSLTDVLKILGYGKHSTKTSRPLKFLSKIDPTCLRSDITIQTTGGLQKMKCITLAGISQLVDSHPRLSVLDSARCFIEWLISTCEKYAEQDAKRVATTLLAEKEQVEEGQFFNGLFPIYQTAGSNKLLRLAGLNLLNPETSQMLEDKGVSGYASAFLPAIDLIFHHIIEANYKACKEAQSIIKKGDAPPETSKASQELRSWANGKLITCQSATNLNPLADTVCLGKMSRDKKKWLTRMLDAMSIAEQLKLHTLPEHLILDGHSQEFNEGQIDFTFNGETAQYLREGSTWTFPFPLLLPAPSLYSAPPLANTIPQIRSFLYNRLMMTHFKMNYGKQDTQGGRRVDPTLFTPEQLYLIAGVTLYDEWKLTQSKTHKYHKRWFEYCVKRPLEDAKLFTVEVTEYNFEQFRIVPTAWCMEVLKMMKNYSTHRAVAHNKHDLDEVETYANNPDTEISSSTVVGNGREIDNI